MPTCQGHMGPGASRPHICTARALSPEPPTQSFHLILLYTMLLNCLETWSHMPS